MIDETKRAELRAKAEAATPGPWKETAGYVCLPKRFAVEMPLKADAAHIAANDPQTTLALLDALDAVEQAHAVIDEEWRQRCAMAVKLRDKAKSERDALNDALTREGRNGLRLAEERDAAIAEVSRLGRELGKTQHERDEFRAWVDRLGNMIEATANVIGDFMLDPPDAGDVRLHEGAQRMKDALEKAEADNKRLREIAGNTAFKNGASRDHR